MLTNRELMTKAKALWAEHPTTSAYARNAHGSPVFHDSPEATCWCAMGALYKVASDNSINDGIQTANYCAQVLGEVLRGSIEPTLVLVRANDDGLLTLEHWDMAIERMVQNGTADTVGEDCD